VITGAVALYGAALSTFNFLRAGPKLRFTVRTGMVEVPSDDKRTFVQKEVTQLDRRLYRDQDAVRPVVTRHPAVDFVEARKAATRCQLRPVAQHALNQPPLVPPRSGYAGLWQSQHGARRYPPIVNENLTAAFKDLPRSVIQGRCPG
jgi:hypothetical protein